MSNHAACICSPCRPLPSRTSCRRHFASFSADTTETARKPSQYRGVRFGFHSQAFLLSERLYYSECFPRCECFCREWEFCSSVASLLHHSLPPSLYLPTRQRSGRLQFPGLSSVRTIVLQQMLSSLRMFLPRVGIEPTRPVRASGF
jgi:hypothetical protein